MAYWLLKSEPEDYSYADLEENGRDVWDGVKNRQAQRNLARMRPGDEFLFYHTGREKAVVGTGTVVSEPHPDPEQPDAGLLVVEVAPGRRLPTPVTLAQIKADVRFAGWELVRLPRLSVMPVPEPIWRLVLEKGGGAGD